ncbi:MAG: DNA-3-methyladenine glycosylase 2 family protein [candidate division Zixibacteria bacterium]|nr:DNA-3-methyladenine glycosylase 2 family protein [candidate division Zixibacteria bacterium]
MPTKQHRDDLVRKARRHFKKADPKMARIMAQIELPFSVIRCSQFEELVRIIIAQQLSGKAAQTIAGRVRGLCPSGKITLPELQKVTDTKLRSVGLSGAKTTAVRDLIAHIEDGRLSTRRFGRMDDEAIIEAITQVKGLGPWSAQMYLMFVLMRPDIFSPGDLGIRSAIRRIYDVDHETTDIDIFGERWKPFRTVACWYLWAFLGSDLAKE